MDQSVLVYEEVFNSGNTKLELFVDFSNCTEFRRTFSHFFLEEEVQIVIQFCMKDGKLLSCAIPYMTWHEVTDILFLVGQNDIQQSHIPMIKQNSTDISHLKMRNVDFYCGLKIREKINISYATQAVCSRLSSLDGFGLPPFLRELVAQYGECLDRTLIELRSFDNWKCSVIKYKDNDHRQFTLSFRPLTMNELSRKPWEFHLAAPTDDNKKRNIFLSWDQLCMINTNIKNTIHSFFSSKEDDNGNNFLGKQFKQNRKDHSHSYNLSFFEKDGNKGASS